MKRKKSVLRKEKCTLKNKKLNILEQNLLHLTYAILNGPCDIMLAKIAIKIFLSKVEEVEKKTGFSINKEPNNVSKEIKELNRTSAKFCRDQMDFFHDTQLRIFLTRKCRPST